jgi:acetylornithine/succinyldiaminopimelate/putrescine aminotransferase
MHVTHYSKVLVEEDLAGNAEKMGKRLREGIASMNSPLVTEIRGRGLLNAIVIDESMGKNVGPDGFAWDICVNLAEMGKLPHFMLLLMHHEIAHSAPHAQTESTKTISIICTLSHYLFLRPHRPALQTDARQHHPFRPTTLHQRRRGEITFRHLP